MEISSLHKQKKRKIYLSALQLLDRVKKTMMAMIIKMKMEIVIRRLLRRSLSFLCQFCKSSGAEKKKMKEKRMTSERFSKLLMA